MTQFFVPAEDVGIIPQIFLIVVYGFILLKASQTLAHGSEILLDIYGAGIVGGLIIPIFGAVPDGMIILLSGISSTDKAEIQEQISVGVGTLAGSTIMLITVPWAIGVYLNRRVLDPRTGKAGTEWYVKPGTTVRVLRPAIPTTLDMKNNVATVLKETPKFAKIMMASLIVYAIVQIPAFGLPTSQEKYAVLTGLIVALLCFIAYCIYQLKDQDSLDMSTRKQHTMTDFKRWIKSGELTYRFSRMGGTFDKVFRALDRDNDGYLDFKEMRKGLLLLGLQLSEEEARQMLNLIDVDGDDRVSLSEFGHFVENFMDRQVTSAIAEDEAELHREMNGAEREAFARRKDPGLPPADILTQLTNWYSSDDITLVLSIDDSHIRHQVHEWARRCMTPYSVTHFTEDAPGQHITKHSAKQPKRNVRLKKVILNDEKKLSDGQQPHSILHVYRRPITHRDLPIWANCSDAAIEYCQQGGTMDALFAGLDVNKSGGLSILEVKQALTRFQLHISEQALLFAFHAHDQQFDRLLSKDEFTRFLSALVDQSERKSVIAVATTSPSLPSPSEASASASSPSTPRSGLGEPLLPAATSDTTVAVSINSEVAVAPATHSTGKHDGDDNDDDDVEEHEDEMADWSVGKKKAFAAFLLIGGTAIITIFSDPMVDTLSAFADNIGVSAFYVSFLITPLASNASEVIGSLYFASKKTNSKMSITLSSLYGAATMNSTFCLAIFYALVYFQGLTWDFTAEVIAIVVVVIVVGINGTYETVNMWQALLVFSMFPFSLFLVAMLETYGGLK